MPSSIHKPARDAIFQELFDSGSLPAAYTDDPESLYSEYREIGHGNFGSVYYAVEKSTSEVVAVKKMSIVSANSLKDLKQKYDDVCREIRTLRTLGHHPNLLAFRRAHCDAKQGLILLVTEYCLGSCADVLETLREIDERDIAAIISQTLAGLVYVHSHGSIHRDVKASNILIGERGVVKLADFGSTSTSSTANSFVGTPFWIAPEVILAMDTGQYDARADVWSLGVTCHELVDGRPPYFSLNPMSALYQIAHNEPPQLASRRRPHQFRRGVRRITQESGTDNGHSESTDTDGANGNGNGESEPDGEDVVFSEEFRDFVSNCMQKDASKRPHSDWLYTNHPFVVRDDARSTQISFELLVRTRRTLSVADPLKHRRIRENFNADPAGPASITAGFENAFADHLERIPGDTRRPMAEPVSIAISNVRKSETVTESGDEVDEPDDSEDRDTMLSEATNELANTRLQPPAASNAPQSATSSFVDADSDSGPSALRSAANSGSFDMELPHLANIRPRARMPDGDAKFATLKTKNMLRRELEESQKYVSIREKFAALKRLRIAQQKELRTLEARYDTELRDLRTRLARAYEDEQREASKDSARLEERQRADADRRERDIAAAWKRAASALQKLRKRTLNANAGGLRFGALAKAANRGAVEAVAHAETRLKVLERLKLQAMHKFSAQSATESRARRELTLGDEQRLIQLHNEQIENAQLARVENLYRAKQTHLERQFELERENHAAYFRGESEKLTRSHERFAKDLSKSRKLTEAASKREAEVIAKTVDKDLRIERTRIEADTSLSKSDREAAVRTAKERSERRRADALAALRHRVESEITEASRSAEERRDADLRALDARTRDELALLARGQEVAAASLDTERAAELERERQRAAANQRDIDARCASDRDALRARCDAEAAALREAHAAALRDFDSRALADLTAQQCALLAAGATQYSSTANLQSSAAGAQQASAPVQPSTERRFSERLYAAYIDALTPRDVDAFSAAQLYELVMREVDRFCAADHSDPSQLLVAIANNRALPPARQQPNDPVASSDNNSSVDSSVVSAPSELQAQGTPNAANGAVRLRNDPGVARSQETKAKRSSMLALGAAQSQPNEREMALYDYNGAMPRGLPSSVGTPTKSANQPAVKASLMQSHNNQLHMQAPGLPYPAASGAKVVSGSAGRKAGSDMQQRSANGGSPSSSTSGSSRQSGAPSHRRRLLGLFDGSHDESTPSPPPASDSINLNVTLSANMNVPRNRLSMNIASSATPRANDASDNTQM